MKMKTVLRLLAIIPLLFCIAINVWSTGYYELGSPQTYEVRRILEIHNRGGAATNFKGKIMLFDREEMPPYQKILSCSIYTSQVKPKLFKDYAEFVVPKIGPNQSIMIEFEYWITNYTIEYHLDEYTSRYIDETRFLGPEPGIESNAKPIVDLANQLTSGQPSNLMKAKNIFAFVNNHFEYKITQEKSHSALTALRRGYGACVDFSLAYIALCRAAGIPARYATGYRFDEGEISGRKQEIGQKAHAWVEIALPRIGWITVDPTYLYTVDGVKEISYDFFGKINKKDRHLFVNYNRKDDFESAWEYEKRSPAKIESKMSTYIRKVQ